jgi:GSCFA family
VPIEILPADVAWDVHRKNARSRWPTPSEPSTPLYPLTLPRFDARFQLRRSDAIFCLGSCFAREIEAVLARHDFNVLSLLPADEAGDDAAGVTNRYAAPVMRQEVEQALLGSSSDDAHATARERAATRSFRRLKDATVVVLTLGLSEVWYDKLEQRYLNRMPDKRLLQEDKPRFELHVLDVTQTIRELREMLALFARHLAPGWRVLLTVSPVPLRTTFRNCDVVTANAYSKAVLRCAAEALQASDDRIAYFPSFEMVTTSDHRAVFGASDYRHVDREFVDLIMSHALSVLLPDEAAAFGRDVELARERLQAKLRKLDDDPLGRRPGVLRRVEGQVLERLLSKKRLRKYRRHRDAFFEDSASRWVRLLGRLL